MTSKQKLVQRRVDVKIVNILNACCFVTIPPKDMACLCNILGDLLSHKVTSEDLAKMFADGQIQVRELVVDESGRGIFWFKC